MKKTIIALFAALCFAGSANAQGFGDIFAPGDFDWQFDVRGTLLGSSMYIKDQVVTGTFRIAPGFNLEGGVALQLTNGLYLRTGVGIADRCSKVLESLLTYTTYYNALYLTVPLTLSFRLEFNSGTTGYLDLGGYFGYGLTGQVRSQDYRKDFFGKDYNFSRYDGGLRFGLGSIIKDHFLVGLFLDQGLANIYNAPNGTAKNYSFGAQVGWVF